MEVTRENIMRFNEGSKAYDEVIDMEKMFDIKLNVVQLAFMFNRSWGKSYLSYAQALYYLVAHGELSVDASAAYDPDIGNSHQRKNNWMAKFERFAYDANITITRSGGVYRYELTNEAEK